MPLSMSRPWKHPDSGVYWFRRAVPADLRARVGKREEKRSLQTKDPSIARRRHAEALAEVEARWANLRGGGRTLSERETHELAAVSHDRWLELYKNNPSEQTTWRVDLGDRLWQSPAALAGPLASNFLSEYDADAAKLRDMENWCRAGAKDCLAARGLVVDQESELVLAKALSFAIQRASLALARYAKGEFGVGARAGGVWQGNPSVVPDTGLPVPLADFAAIATASGLAARAHATWVWSELDRAVHVTVAGAGGARLSGSSLALLKSALDSARDPNRPLMLANVVRIPIVISARLLRNQAFETDVMLEDARAKLLALFAFDAMPLGNAVFASEIYAALQSATGVVAVDIDVLHLKGYQDLTATERAVRAVDAESLQPHIRIFPARPTPPLALIDRFARTGFTGAPPPVLAAEQAFIEEPASDLLLTAVEAL
jgi:hypothetical protein